MKRLTQVVRLALCTLVLLGLAAAPASATKAVGVRGDGSLSVLDTSGLATAETRAVTGLASGYFPDDVDVRPATGVMYLVARSSGGNLRLYTLDPGSGAAAPVGTAAFRTGVSGPIGIDFDSGTDRLRVVGSGGLNLEVHPDTAAVTALPAHTGKVASVGHDGTTLFGWDHDRRRLVEFTGPNTLSDVGGASGVTAATAESGFDIEPGGPALLTIASGTSRTLQRANLTTGLLTSLGSLPQTLDGLALLPPTPFSLPATDFSVEERSGALSVTVRRPSATGTMAVRYATSDGTATVDDYEPAAGTLTFPPGVAERSFEVPVVDDRVVEPPQTVALSLSDPTGGAELGVASTAKLTILDDDAPVLPADRLAPQVLLAPDVRRLSLRRLVKKGIPGSFSCSEACRGEVALRFRSVIVLGAGGRILDGAGPGRFTVRLTPGGKRLLRRQLRRRARVRLGLVLRAIDPARNIRLARVTFVVTRR